MSLENARKHWRFLATVLLIFVGLAAAGPLLFYGLPSLLGPLADRYGNESLLIFAMIFAAGTLGWLFFVLWAGDKADRLTLNSDASSGDEHTDG